MEEILASIRRILNEDEVKPAAPPAVAPVPGPAPASLASVPAPASHAPLEIEGRAEGVLVLDETMMVPPEPEPARAVLPPPPEPPAPAQDLNAAPPADPVAAGPVPPALPLPVQFAAHQAQVMDAPNPGFTPLQVPPVADPAQAMPRVAAPPPAAPGTGPLDPGPALVGPAAAGAAGAAVEALVRTLARERQTTTHRGGPTIEDLVREEVRPLLTQWLDTHLPPLVERLVRAEIERVMGRMAP